MRDNLEALGLREMAKEIKKKAKRIASSCIHSGSGRPQQINIKREEKQLLEF